MENQGRPRPRHPSLQEPATVKFTLGRRPLSSIQLSMILCLVIILAYIVQPNVQFQSWIVNSHRRDNGLERTSTRPRIELHPEEHAFRPPRTQHLDLRITSGSLRPDGVLKQIYLVNGIFPGPTIEARSGDTLVVKVTNALEKDPVTLHWHGLHVSNAVDGAAGVTQCPIAPGGQYIYNIVIPSGQHGTFWYHAHAGVSRSDGLYGGLVVHAPASTLVAQNIGARDRDDFQRYGYEKELLLLIGDWYHRPAAEVLAWFMNPGNAGNEPVPDSLLINGVGHFNCSMASLAHPLDCIDQPRDSSFLDLDPDTVYRIRVVNTGSFAGFTLVFDQKRLDIIQVDGSDVDRPQEKNVNTVGILHNGQRMDFLLYPPSQSHARTSSMMIQLDQQEFKFANLALTPNQTFAISHDPKSKQNISILPPNIRQKTDLAKLPSASHILKALPEKAEQTFVVYTKIQKMSRNANMPFGYFNHTTWKLQKDPRVPLIKLPRNAWDKNQFGITTGPGPVWVDLVVNNLDEGSHPFHLHGHHFYVLRVYKSTIGFGTYDESYNPFTDRIPPGLEKEVSPESIDPAQPFDLRNASLRDTVQIPRHGYAVLRFRADNPGVWLFHCHMMWHMATGMAMLIDVQGDPAGELAHESSSAGNGKQCLGY